MTDPIKNSYSEWCILSFLSGILGLILPPFSSLALLFGIGGIIHARREQLKGRWMAVLGMILGVLGIIIFVTVVVAAINYARGFMSSFGSMPLDLTGK